MKNLNLKIAGIIVLSLLTVSTFAQTFWQKGGNAQVPPLAPSTIGTDASWNAPFSIMTNGFQRMLINNGGNGIMDGRVALGNNLPVGFIPANRLHLHQDLGTNGIQFTNNFTGITAFNGLSMNLQTTGRFDFNQFSNQTIRFVMPNSLLMELFWNRGPGNIGQVQIRPVINPASIYNPSLLNLGGAIGFSQGISSDTTNTLLYHNTRIFGPTNSPDRDGFRMQYSFNSEGQSNADCLVFEKTDGQTPEPDGCIKFTNFGSDTIQKLSMTIEGNGHVGIGRPYNLTVVPWRRLSVQDISPQLRLTYNSTDSLHTDIYSDFYTDSIGDLYIDPRFANNDSARVVRINYQTGLVQPFPELSLDVNGQQNIRTVNQDTTLNKVLVWDSITGNVRRRNIDILGNYCGNPTNSLITDFEIDMQDKNFLFRRGGSVLIGDVFCGQSASSRLFIRNTFALPALKPFGMQVETANHPATNIAGYFQTTPSGNFNIGIYSQCIPINSTTPPNPPTSGNFAAYFDGDVYVSGRSYLGMNAMVISDQNVKTAVDTITDAKSIITQLKPKIYYYDTIAHPEMNFTTRKQFGFIAQDVEQILPELVETQLSVAKFDSTGAVINNPQTFKNLNYNSFIAILTKGIQEQQTKIDSLESVLINQDSINNALYSMIAQCCNNNTGMQQNNTTNDTRINVITVELTDAKANQLGDATPNPFSDMASIPYFLIEGIQKAQMVFYDEQGKIINTVDLSNQSGKGQLNIKANELSSGIYFYSLVVDGKLIETKKMIKQK